MTELQTEQSTVATGRYSYFSPEGEIYVELNGINNPCVSILSGINIVSDESGLVKTSAIWKDISFPADSKIVSRSGNGHATYDLHGAFGIYKCSNFVWPSRRNITTHVQYSADGVRELSTAQVSAMARKMPGSLALIDEAARFNLIVQDIIEERKINSKSVVIDGVVASPVFGDLPGLSRLKGHCRGVDNEGGATSVSDEQFVVQNGTPQQYKVSSPVFASGKTAEEAVAKAKQIVFARETAAKEAMSKAAEMDLPDLTGSPKQIAWASQIRAEVAKNDPSHPSLRKFTAASYWIDTKMKKR